MRASVVAILVMLCLTSPEAQTPPGSGAIDITPADVQAMIDSGSGGPIRSINAGEHVVFAWYTTRRPAGAGAETRGELHTQMTEIYYILEGSGTLNTGGTMTLPRKLEVTSSLPGTENVPTFSTPTYTGPAEGGVSRTVSAGDVIVIPPGTVHFFESIDTPSLAYLNVRIDPEHQLHAPYVNPVLAK